MLGLPFTKHCICVQLHTFMKAYDYLGLASEALIIYY